MADTDRAPDRAPDPAEADTPTPVRRGRVRRSFLRDLAIAGVTLLVVVLVVAPGLGGAPETLSRSQILGTLGITVIAALGLNLLAGYAGQISLGQGGFIAAGAYLSAWLHLDVGLPWTLAIVFAVAISGALGALLALAAVRLHGPQVAMVTLAFAIVVQRVLNDAEAFGRLAGYPNTSQHGSTLLDPAELFGVRLEPPIFGGVAPWIVLVIAVVVAVAFVLYRNLVRSAWGRSLKAIRESELVAAHFGIDTTRRKVGAFTVAAVFGAVAGVLVTQLTAHLQPESFTFVLSLNLIVIVILGGSGRLMGPVVGAVLLRFVEESHWIDELVAWQRSTISDSWYLSEPGIVGLLLILTLALLPQGLVGGAATAFARLRDRRRGDEDAEDDVAEAELGSTGEVALSRPTTDAGDVPVLRVRGLGHAFDGNRAVDEMTLDVRAGTIHALIGPNGAGKTTVVNLVSGVYAIQDGKVEILGTDATAARAPQIHRLGVARTFQTPQLFNDDPAIDNLLAGMNARLDEPFWATLVRTPRIYREEARAADRAHDLLGTVGLDEHAGTIAGELPYGLQRALELGRALASEPRLLILDEPAAGLNPAESRELGRLLRRIAATGVAILLVEHDMDLVTSIADEVTCMEQGRLLYHGDAAGLHRDERVLAAYLGTAAVTPSTTEGDRRA
ncbi:branched-chain amino acid ABC transporter ATP-binding protein/permease [Nitriliruptoraceae bacterium ZYF776]|nr:branched-chain amino acid ABC transporter ATP-binding protein/permease [Profundirhabdus halotolerans]